MTWLWRKPKAPIYASLGGELVKPLFTFNARAFSHYSPPPTLVEGKTYRLSYVDADHVRLIAEDDA